MVFYSPVWRLFYPLLLSTAHRQDDDACFFNISERTLQQLSRKHSQYRTEDNAMTTIHIVGYRQHADCLNNMITSSLPSCNNFQSVADDYGNGNQLLLLPGEINRAFKRLTNLPDRLDICHRRACNVPEQHHHRYRRMHWLQWGHPCYQRRWINQSCIFNRQRHSGNRRQQMDLGEFANILLQMLLL
jgi:hypothetical protein